MNFRPISADGTTIRRSRCWFGWIGLALSAVAAFAQYQRGYRSRIPEDVRTAREIPTRSVDTPMWENPKPFGPDVFTFTRLRYGGDYWRGNAGGGSWSTDLPDADLNLSYRLQQMTSLKVDPHARIIRANDPDLSRFPFLMSAAGGAMELKEDERVGLRQYLLNGGFFLMTDFWGDREWEHFERVMRTVLPEHRFVELSLDHPVYQCLFPIKKKNQVPRIDRVHLRVDAGTNSKGNGRTGF